MANEQRNRGILTGMLVPRSVRATALILKNPSLLRSRKYLFIVSHMRSYSTLLAHILGSHKEISGYAESNLSYRGNADLFKLRCVTCLHGNFKNDCVYVLDKIIASTVEVSDRVLANPDIVFLFLIRRPGPTLKSIVNILRREAEKLGSSWDEQSLYESGLARYLAHLDSLSDTARRISKQGRRPVLLEAERILEETATVLKQLESHLRLGSKLGENYSVFEYTGEYFKGDVSDYIRSGSIQRARDAHTDVELPSACLERAELEYQRCLNVLNACCVPLTDSVRVCEETTAAPAR